MGKQVLYVKGFDGQVELMTDRVVIHRRGILNVAKFGLGAKREIPLGAIAEVVFKDATPVTFGKIEFIRAGRSQDERSVRDYSAVRFGRRSQRAFSQLNEQIFEILDQYRRAGR